ncbi:MAG: C-GCAxxG-C-C family protein, partial [Oscillospiraceae bacterium]
MNAYSEKAKDLFRQGYNCSQAVFATFADELGIDFDTALKISSSFGGGMGRLREVCGTVSAMFLIAGIKYGYTSPTNQVAKTEHYKRIQELAETFKIKNNSIVCRELLGLDKADMKNIGYVPEIRNDQYYKKRPCVELVGDAAE